MNLPAYLGAYSDEIFLLLTFVVGILIGLAVKKGSLAIVFIIVAYLIASYIALPYLPTINYTAILNSVYSYSTVVHFTKPVISFGLIIFAIGIVIGLWKG